MKIPGYLGTLTESPWGEQQKYLLIVQSLADERQASRAGFINIFTPSEKVLSDKELTQELRNLLVASQPNVRKFFLVLHDTPESDQFAVNVFKAFGDLRSILWLKPRQGKEFNTFASVLSLLPYTMTRSYWEHFPLN